MTFDNKFVQDILCDLNEKGISIDDILGAINVIQSGIDVLKKHKLKIPGDILNKDFCELNSEDNKFSKSIVGIWKIQSSKLPTYNFGSRKRKNDINNECKNKKKREIDNGETKENAPFIDRFKSVCYDYGCRRKDLHQIKRHTHYTSMCQECGDFNLNKRNQVGNFTGKTALVTGGRIKIGYQTALKLLRGGAENVVVSTRFPASAIEKYMLESDYSEWKDKLYVYYLNLLDYNSISTFINSIKEKFKKLDIVILNAAQTIRRPPPYYRTLIENECRLQNEQALTISNYMEMVNHNYSKIPSHPDDAKYKDERIIEQLWPSAKFDNDGQQLDLRFTNSWSLHLEEVHKVELAETTIINYIANYILIAEFIPLLKQSNDKDYSNLIIATAMEGKFENCFKRSRHPHTNAAKAALNMLVRTCSRDYMKKHRIVMSAVDTGWVTDENPVERRVKDFVPPLDDIDGASRLIDPVIQVYQGDFRFCGKFVKDYEPTSW